MNCKYFLPFCGLLFHCLGSALWRPKVYHFLLSLVLLVSYLRNHCLIQGHENLCLYFLIRVLEFGSFISDSFWACFCMVWDLGPTSFFCMWLCNCPSAVLYCTCPLLHQPHSTPTTTLHPTSTIITTQSLALRQGSGNVPWINQWPKHVKNLLLHMLKSCPLDSLRWKSLHEAHKLFNEFHENV